VKLLATTAFQETWGKEEEILFLGEWCRTYHSRNIWENRNHQTVRNHWDDREKLRADENYLNDLHNMLIIELSRVLNDFHGLDYTTSYWQMLLDPWLLTYIAVIWDRWEYIRIAFEEYNPSQTITYDKISPGVGVRDYMQFQDDIVSDLWNHSLFIEIIKTHYAERLEIITVEDQKETGRSHLIKNKNNDESIKIKIVRFLDSLLRVPSIQNDYVLYHTYFPPLSLIRLMLSIGQIPRFYINDFTFYPNYKKLKSDPQFFRDKLSLNLASVDEYEQFLFQRIISDIPQCLVENYSELKECANKSPYHPKVIATANAHWANDYFKIWAAEKVYTGSRFIVMEHGGSFPPLFDSMQFEQNISHISVVWCKPYHPKHIQLPSNKLSGLKHRIKKSEYVTIVGFEPLRYSCRATASAISSQGLVHFDMVCEVYKKLSPKLTRFLRIKPYPNRGYHFEDRYKDLFGDQVIWKERNLKKIMGESKIIICTYPNTTFSEAMYSGVPSMLFYDPYYWETVPVLDNLLYVLKDAKIIHTDSSSLVHHLESIWMEPLNWWNSSEIQNARVMFNEEALGIKKNWLEVWGNFFKKELDMSLQNNITNSGIV
jgi:putative transferase (TIGR04331 family)